MSEKEKHVITIECNSSAKDDLVPLLETLSILGNVGNTRTIRIEDWREDSTFTFDGDGPSRIIDIKVDGRKIKEGRRPAKIPLSRLHLRQLKEVVKVKDNQVLKAFYRSCERSQEAPESSIEHVLEVLNDIYWNDRSLTQKEQKIIKEAYDSFKELKSSRKRKKDKGKMTLEDIKRNQEERRRRGSYSLQQDLIILGKHQPSLRKHLIPILDEITNE